MGKIVVLQFLMVQGP